VCCSVLQCVAVSCIPNRISFCIPISMSSLMLQCVAVCCGVPQCVAVCCSVLQ